MIAQIPEDLVWSQIVARAWCDERLMKRLLAEPRAVLAENDLEVPSGTEVDVVLGTEVKVDVTDTMRRFVLTPRPSHELLDEELIGDIVGYCYSAACGRCGGCGCRCRC